MTSLAEISLITDTSSGGQVRVRGVNDCAGSDDFSEYSWLTFSRRAGIELLEYPQTVPMGEIDTYKFSVLLNTGVTYEWRCPIGWSINGEGNSYVGSNVVQITTSECPTDEKVTVRMVQGNDISPWVEFPTKVALPTINIPSEEIKQYQPTTFSLNFPNDDIETVEWFVNSKSVGVVANSSSLSFLINESGKVNVSAILTLNGCSAVTIPEIEVDVTKAPDPFISGPNSFCEEATYRINNLPLGATVQWSVSRNLNINSGQGTSSIAVSKRVENSNNTVTAEITISGNMITINKSGIQSGGINPSILLSPLTGPTPGPHVQYGETGKKYWLHASGSNLSNKDSDYKWTFYSSDPYELPVKGTGRQIEYTQVTPGDYRVSLQYNGECGWTAEIFRTIRFE